jgi:hypothetical protein
MYVFFIRRFDQHPPRHSDAEDKTFERPCLMLLHDSRCGDYNLMDFYTRIDLRIDYVSEALNRFASEDEAGVRHLQHPSCVS